MTRGKEVALAAVRRGDGACADEGLAGRAPRRRRFDGLPVKAEAVFFDTLAATCCVRAAAMAAGTNRAAVYGLKRRDPVFADRWLEALHVGYDAVEGKMLRYVLTGGCDAGDAGKADESAVVIEGEGGTGGEKAPTTTIGAPGALATRFRHGVGRVGEGVPAWVQVGLALLNRHRASVTGGKPGMKPRRLPTPEETDALIAERLDMLRRSMERGRGPAEA